MRLNLVKTLNIKTKVNTRYRHMTMTLTRDIILPFGNNTWHDNDLTDGKKSKKFKKFKILQNDTWLEISK